MLSNNIAAGNAKGHGLKLLKFYTGQDFGENWSSWEKWLSEKDAQLKIER